MAKSPNSSAKFVFLDEGKITDLECGNYLINLTIGKQNDAYTEFIVYQCTSVLTHDQGEVDASVVPHFERKGSKSSNDTTDKLEEAKIFMEGSIKWDGCLNIDFFPEDEGYSHFCSKSQASEIGLLLAALYEKASEIMPRVEQGSFE